MHSVTKLQMFFVLLSRRLINKLSVESVSVIYRTLFGPVWSCVSMCVGPMHPCTS
jgi:hypothetical protein